MTNEHIIDHEVRIRIQENISSKLDARLDKIENKIDSNFHWVIGTMFTLMLTTIALFGGIAFHLTKLS